MNDHPSYVEPDTRETKDPEQIHILLPGVGRNERKFAEETGDIIGPLNVAFIHGENLVEVIDEPPPSDDAERLDRNKLARGGLKFRSFTGTRAKGWIEQFLTTGVMAKREGSEEREFKEKTMSEEQSRSLLENPFYRERLPKIARILPVPIPVLTQRGDLRIPKPGYNAELRIYCPLSTPEIYPLDIERAKKVLEAAHAGFEFKNEQSRTHAYARFLTPFFRGAIGFTEPVPCWFFNANRPRAGKDYLAGVTQITYEGFAFEDAALGESADETCKRITAGLMAGRRFFHFANCQGYLQDKYFTQAITGSIWCARLLGGNGAKSDLIIRNEAEYSLSANAGLTYREDVGPRLRKIELAYYEEDANARVFPMEDLHGWVSGHRSLLLSAAHAIYAHWVSKGMPPAHPFASYKRWGKFVGGAMKLAELGDPTLPHDEDPLIAGDQREAAMRAVYKICYDHYGEQWKPKAEIYQIVTANQERDERLNWFGDLNGLQAKSALMKLGRALSFFNCRWLSDIRLLIDTADSNSQRWKLKFTKNRS